MFDEAKTLYERALRGHETRLSEENNSTKSNTTPFTSSKHVGGIDDLLVTVDDDIESLDVITNLANVLYSLGQLQESKVLWERGVRGYESMLGVYHLDTFRTMGNLANVLNAQGEYDEAIGVYGRVLRGKEQTLGVHDSDTLATAHDLAG